MKMPSSVAVVNTYQSEYPQYTTNYRPSKEYPEIKKLGFGLTNKRNTVYDAVRECFFRLDLDRDNYGSEKWNPLGDYIKPGDYVLIKPNLVMDYNQNFLNGDECLYTQPGVVAAVIDYVILALHGDGRIVVGDAPMQECNFENIKNKGYGQLIRFYQEKNINIELVDFRELKSVVKDGIHHNIIDSYFHGMIVDLGDKSEFARVNEDRLKRMRVTNYDPRILNRHHTQNKHEYYISEYVLRADVIINMPKPKTHRKAGVTISLKNLVGINTRKEFLPHHTMGSVQEDGDEYEKKNRLLSLRSHIWDVRNIASATGYYNKAKLYQFFNKILSRMLIKKKDIYSEGNWWGNHTISKTIVDINKICLYADKEGVLQDRQNRKMIIVGDMVISGEKEGPLCPFPKKVGYIVAGTNPVCFDEAIATVMGFDYHKIPSIVCSRNVQSGLTLVEKEQYPILKSNMPELNNMDLDNISDEKLLQFEPTSGWKNHIEK